MLLEHALEVDEHNFSKNTNWHTYHIDTKNLLNRVFYEHHKILVDLYLQELKDFENMEPVSAPSGEWAEYNIDYIAQESRVEALAEALELTGIVLED